MSSYNSNGTRTESSWGCCSKESETNQAGTTTTFIYDDLQRIEKSIRQGLNSDIETSYTYDAAGRQLTQAIRPRGSGHGK